MIVGVDTQQSCISLVLLEVGWMEVVGGDESGEKEGATLLSVFQVKSVFFFIFQFNQ
jgi:hypothetical protein